MLGSRSKEELYQSRPSSQAERIPFAVEIRGLPIAAPEADGHGVVPVTSHFRSRHRELLRHEENGLYFRWPTCRRRQFRCSGWQRIRRIRPRLSQAAFQAVRFDDRLDGMIERYARLFDETLARPPRTGHLPATGQISAGRSDAGFRRSVRQPCGGCFEARSATERPRMAVR